MKPKGEIRIFLAHASEDKARAIELYRKLKNEGYKPWLDKFDLIPGTQWKNEIPKALRNSTIFIACLSAISIQKRGYVQSEFRLALRQAADMPANEIYIIPLKFDECRIPDLEQADYGVKLQDFQWLDYWEEDAFDRLVTSIEYRREQLEVSNEEPEDTDTIEIKEATESEGAIKYRERVKSYLVKRELTKPETIALDRLRKQLNLSEAEAKRIIDEEQAPIFQARQEYREFLQDLIDGDCYPFDEHTEKLLKSHQEENNLLDEEVEEIKRPILEEAERAYREKLRQEARQRELEQQRAKKAERERIIKILGGPLQRWEFDVITVDRRGKETKRARQSAEFIAVALGNGVSLEMVKIPGGTFQMGSAEGEGDDDEHPQHPVTVPSFLMGKYPVTQAQWRAVTALPQVEISLDPDPSYFKGDNRPVERISWHEAVEFCQRLSRLTGHPYRLPSEAEWEYASRAGTTTPFHFGETITGDLANYRASAIFAEEPKGNYRGETTPAGQFPPNAFGLYDMHGNIWEWCADHWHNNYQGAPKDEKPWITGENAEKRVIRGGSWDVYPANCRSAVRVYNSPADRNDFCGFRVSRAVSPGLF